MFYQIYRPAKYFFSETLYPLDARQFKDSLLYQWNRLPEPNRYGMMNVSATHDSPRLLTCFNNPGKYKYHAKPSEDPKYRSGKPEAETYRRVRFYLIYEFTGIGAPHIWNGDEMGMWGGDDPDCRKPLRWKEFTFQPETRNPFTKDSIDKDPVAFNQELFDFYKKMIRIRHENPVLSSGKIRFIKSEGKALGYHRYDGHQQIVVLFNLEPKKISFDLPEKGNYQNLLDDQKIGGAAITLDPMSAVVLKKL
jgi:glycosidase